jgi:hypothetical protein
LYFKEPTALIRRLADYSLPTELLPQYYIFKELATLIRRLADYSLATELLPQYCILKNLRPLSAGWRIMLYQLSYSRDILF